MEEPAMETIFGTVLVGLLTIGPLAWRNFVDRRNEQALVVRARIHARLRRLFRGEPLMAIDVHPVMPWRTGRVVLSTPAGWEFLVEQAWDALLAEVPTDHELVIKPARRAERRHAALAPIARHA
jgi:hypothetical protein